METAHGFVLDILKSRGAGSQYSFAKILNRLLKNAHLRRYPAASPSRRRGKKSLLIRRDATPHPSPCQARGRLVAAYIQARLTPQDFGRLASACLRVAASAEAGAFLISLKKMSFSTGS
jgi:hypothetical protein